MIAEFFKPYCIMGLWKYRESAYSARPRKIPGWIVLVRENISVNKRAYRKSTIEILLRRFLCAFLFNFTYGFHGFHLKKLKII